MKLPKLIKLATALLWPFAPLAQDAPPVENALVGGKVCQACHRDLGATFHRNAHFRSQSAGKEPPERTGCEGCHGPGQNHVLGGGDKSKIRVFPRLSAAEVLAACLECHQDDLPRAHIQRSSHTLAGVVCTNCHSIHAPATPKFLLAKNQTDMCYACHPAVRAQFAMPFKHRVNEGTVSCTDCHNPHGVAAPTWRMGGRPRMVDTRLGNEEPCLKCHTDKRGPFTFEHPAVRVDGCEACHTPHGSMNARLLRRPVVFTVCLECHNGAGNFGRQGDGIRLQSASHNMTDPRYQNCTTCHVRIHGSNSSRLFLR
jgi:DmsE family decaheme c-type cytochrome